MSMQRHDSTMNVQPPPSHFHLTPFHPEISQRRDSIIGPVVARNEVRRPRRGRTVLSRRRDAGSEQRFALHGAGRWCQLSDMDKPFSPPLQAVARAQRSPESWHGFTFPSNPIVGSAAQFNSSVSIEPPHHISCQINAFSRRHDGYTAKG